MDPTLRALLCDTIQQAPHTGQNEYGTPTYGPAVSRAARIEWTVQRFVDSTGQERVSRAIVYLDGDVGLDLRDQVTLSDGSTPALRRLETWMDEHGQRDHLRVYI